MNKIQNAQPTVYARRQERLAEDERFFLEFQKKNWVVVKLRYWEEAGRNRKKKTKMRWSAKKTSIF